MERQGTQWPLEPLTLLARFATMTQVSESLLQVIQSRFLHHLPSGIRDWVDNNGVIRWDMSRSSLCIVAVRFDKDAGRWVADESAHQPQREQTESGVDVSGLFTTLVTSDVYSGKNKTPWTLSVSRRSQPGEKKGEQGQNGEHGEIGQNGEMDQTEQTTSRFTRSILAYVLSVDPKKKEATLGYRMQNSSVTWQEDYQWIVKFEYDKLRAFLELHKLDQMEIQSTDLQEYIDRYKLILQHLSTTTATTSLIRWHEKKEKHKMYSNCKMIGVMPYPLLNVLQQSLDGESTDPMICEIYMNPKDKSFQVKHVREDKSVPNFITTVLSVLQSHLCNISTREFFQRLKECVL
jgi:hypothetical protein